MDQESHGGASRAPRWPLLGLLAVGACASGGPSLRADVDSLRREMGQLSQRQAETQRKMETLENRLLVVTRRLAGDPAAGRSGAERPPPGLAVVKLKPPPAAPAIPTAVTLREPDPSVVEELAAPLAQDEPADDPHVLVEYEEAVEAVKTGSVESGIDRLLAFAKEHPKHPLADNALLYTGQGLRGLGQFGAAASAFEQVLRQYPAGDAVPEALLGLSECRVKLSQPEEARALLKRLMADFPGTPSAKRAEVLLAGMQSPK